MFCAVGLSSAEYQQPVKASSVSINWTLGDTHVEVVNTTTGRRRDSGAPSRLCKHALFTRWSRLDHKVRPDLGEDVLLQPMLLYTEIEKWKRGRMERKKTVCANKHIHTFSAQNNTIWITGQCTHRSHLY